jgi:hypothetical protein
MIAFMKKLATYLAVLCFVWPMVAHSAPAGYTITITTAYASSDPFQNRIDSAYTQPDTGFFQVAISGDASFSGVIGTIAVSAFAGDLSFRSGPIVLAPGDTVSVAIPYDSSSVGGFNGPHYFYRPGVEIYLSGSLTDGTNTQALNLLVADRDIHSGIWLTDQFNLPSDSFVLQGGDPWGFDTDNSYATSLAYGVYAVSGTVAEPGSLATLAAALVALHSVRRLSRRGLRLRRA